MFNLTTLSLVLLVAFAHLAQLESKSIGITDSKNDEKDPLVALPTEGEANPTGAHQQETHVQYFVQPQPTHYQEVEHQPQISSHEPQEAQYAARPEPQMVQVESEQEPATPSSAYPGEIVYIGQNSEMIGSNLGQPSDLQGIAREISRNSGLTATILTEVPAREMPPDVLEKLKKDYGVKVVATRERPGANLVINCESYGPESSICSRNPSDSHQQVAAYSYAEPTRHEHQTYGYTIQEPEHQVYAGEPSGQVDEQSANYGIRTQSSATEQHDQSGESRPHVELEHNGPSEVSQSSEVEHQGVEQKVAAEENKGQGYHVQGQR